MPSSRRRALLAGAVLVAASCAPRLAAGLDPEKQISQYALRTWSLEEGLPQSSVLAIAQTPEGYLWLQTLDGLVRFDGQRFVVPEEASRLPKTAPFALATDADGNLWAVAEGRVFVRTPGGFDEVLVEGEPVRKAHGLYPRRAGGVWIAGAGPLLVAHAGGAAVAFLDREGRGLEGVVGVAERSGLACFSSSELRCLIEDRLEILAERQELAPGGAPLSAVALTRDGATWVATVGEGLARVAPDRSVRRFGRADGLGEEQIRSLLEDRDGVLWLSAGAGGFARFDGAAFAFSDRIRTVRSIFEDREGNLWLGTNSGGLARLADRPITVVSIPEGLPVATTMAVLEAGDGTLWIGTEGHGLARVRGGRVERVYDRRDGLPHPEVTALAEDREGRLLVGTAAGVARRVGERFERLGGSPSRPVFALLEDHEGTLWAGFLGGLRRLVRGRFVAVPEGELSAVAIGEDPHGTLWLGTNHGLFRARGASLERISDPGPAGTVLALLAEADGVWIGLYGGGLGRWTPTDGFSSLGRDQGLCDASVYAVLDDDAANLWMSSERGVFTVEREAALAVLAGRAERLECRLFGVADGLRSREATGGFQPTAWRGADGALWFATVDGAARVDPARLLVAPAPPLPLAEELRAAERRISLAAPVGGVRLEPRERTFEIHYTAIHLAAPEAVSFRYRLLGVDDEWIEAGSRRTAYYSLSRPGEHRFEVAARLPGSDWSEPAVATVTLLPRFRETTTFALLVALLLLVALASADRVRIAHVRRRELQLEGAVRARTDELEAARVELQTANETLERRVEEGISALRDADRMAAYGHLVAGVAHELRHPIFALRTASHLLAERASKLTGAGAELDLLDRETERIGRLLDDLLELARPAQPTLVATELEPLVEEVVASYRTGRADDEPPPLPVETSVEPDLPPIAAEREKLFRLLLNLLDNARRHARGATRVAIRARVEPGAGSVRITVEDDGDGIPPPRLATLFEPFVSGGGGTGLGLAIARRIVEAHGGRIRVESAPGRGTAFHVDLSAVRSESPAGEERGRRG